MMDTRFGRVKWGPHGARQRTSRAYWRKPLVWDRAAAASGQRHRVFCASLADVFDNHDSILSEWRADLWRLIWETPHLDWMLLTKRPGNIAKMLPPDWGGGYANVWLGCTVVNQAETDRDTPKLLEVPAAVRFLSMEPLLGPVSLIDRDPTKLATGTAAKPENRVYVSLLRGWGMGRHRLPGLDLVIVGGESGHGARAMHPDWVRSLRDQCVAAGTAFFFKQFGEWGPSTPAEAASNPRSGWKCFAGHTHIPKVHELYPENGAAFMARVGKARAGRVLDGRTWDEMPGAAI